MGDQRKLKRACAFAQSRQSLRCSHTWSMEVDEGSDHKSDFKPTRWLRMRVWRMSLQRTKRTIISWHDTYALSKVQLISREIHCQQFDVVTSYEMWLRMTITFCLQNILIDVPFSAEFERYSLYLRWRCQNNSSAGIFFFFFNQPFSLLLFGVSSKISWFHFDSKSISCIIIQFRSRISTSV